jgi:prepilin-type N-terminal cleavage/methylation domain-containing protein
MMRFSTSSSRGFTLVEMLVSLTLGLLVVGGAVQLFSKSVSATWLISQRAELQQNARASSNLLTRDISLAGAGLPTGGVALASGTGSKGAVDFGGHMTFVMGECPPLYSLAIIQRVQSRCVSGSKLSDGSHVNGNSHKAQQTQRFGCNP